jgi:hypothetical protein
VKRRVLPRDRGVVFQRQIGLPAAPEDDRPAVRELMDGRAASDESGQLPSHGRAGCPRVRVSHRVFQ